MMKQEFEKRIAARGAKENFVSDADYVLINFVYAYHPAFEIVTPKCSPKDDIADLYVKYGLRIIKDMECTALLAKGLIDDAERIKTTIEQKKEELKELEDRLANLRK